MTTRRELLRATVAGALATRLAMPSFAGTTADPQRLLGVQLWSVNDALGRDFEGTLRALGGLGFRRVEAAGWQKRPPEQFRRAVERAGLHCDSAHFGMEALAADAAGVASQVRDAGCEYLICASPLAPAPLAADVEWVIAIMRAMTLDAWKHNAELLNRAAHAAAQAGVKFGYHNHVAEFALYGGRRGYDVLLAETDPAQVKLELDVAWAVAAGQDPVALIEELRARIVRLHLKDVVVEPPPGQIGQDFRTAAPGSGVVDWKPLLRAANAAAIPGAYLEVEAPYRRSPLEDLASGRRFLERTLAAL